MLPSEIPMAVGDAINETLDFATWVRGFFCALKLTGFTEHEALQLTLKATEGLLTKKI